MKKSNESGRKTLTKIFSMLFVTLFLAFAFAGCGNGGSGSGKETGSEGETTATSIYLDAIPEGTDLDGETIRFVCDSTTGNLTERSILCDEPSGDIVNASVYKRNNNINDRFNVNVSIAKTAGIDGVSELVRQSVLSASDDYDVVAGYQYFTARLATEGLLLNLNGLPNLDFSREYWGKSIIDGMTYKDATYWCTGDLALRYIGGMYVTFINKTIWENYFPDDDYYQIALDGEWTLDKVNEMTAQVYSDLNMSGDKDNEDLLGLIYHPGDDTGDALYTACGIQFSKRNEDGVPYLSYDMEKIVGYCEKATELGYNNPGVRISGTDTDTTMQIFAAGNAMATFARLYMAEVHFRNMEDDFAVLPMPKYDLEQEDYITCLHDGTTLYGIPTTNTKLEATTILLEAMAAESYRVVTPVWYDMALKVKYVRDSMSGQMIDMIRGGIVGDFAFYYHIGGEESGIAHFFRWLIDGNKNFVSKITAEEPVWEDDMETVLSRLEKYSKN